MAPQKSPAFSFYPRDFLTGTASMSLQEVGAYIRLLSYQWDLGGIPDDADERARLLCCAKAQEKELWKKIGKKFDLVNGVYLNTRLEGERRKQVERRQRLAENGRLGAEAKWQGHDNEMANAMANAMATPLANGWQHDGLSSSSSSSSSKKQVPATNTLFDRWWSAYPKKIGKGGALKAWKAIRVTEPILESMLSALQWQRTQPQWTKDGGAYIPYPATYLNQRRWEDEPFFTTPAPEPILESGPDHPHLKKLREMGITV